MARKIKFPLKMKDGYDARSIEELREHFNLESVLGYFADGRLHTWLKDRYLENEAQLVSELDPNDSELIAKICNILGVEAPNQAVDVDINELTRYNEKRKLLLEKYPEPELMDNIDAVAFNEDDIISIIEKGVKEIYLIDNEFQFPFKIDTKNVQLLKKDGTSLPLDIGIHLKDCKFIGRNASLRVDEQFMGLSLSFGLQVENINFIFADKSVELVFKALILKDVDALLSFAYAYYDSNDYKNAFDYYSIAAELGNPVAQGMLGQMYFRGLGVNRDSVQAAEWYRKAAEQGLASAQQCLGVLYDNGLGVEQDYAKAVEWYRKAAEQGNEDAKERLREMGVY